MTTNYDLWNRLRKDGVEGYLSKALVPGDLTMDITLPLRHDGGVFLETFDSEQYLPLSILDSNYVLKEIVYLYGYTSGGNTGLTIERGQEGTSPVDHAKGNKIVHAATAEDFIAVLKHNNDPDAHRKVMEDIANAAAAAAILAHEAKANPHPQYALLGKLGDPPTIFDTDVIFNRNVTVRGVLLIPKGATLRVEGTLRVETPITNVIEGDIFVHDKKIVVSNTAPQNLLNTVWIQTFGA